MTSHEISRYCYVRTRAVVARLFTTSPSGLKNQAWECIFKTVNIVYTMRANIQAAETSSHGELDPKHRSEWQMCVSGASVGLWNGDKLSSFLYIQQECIFKWCSRCLLDFVSIYFRSKLFVVNRDLCWCIMCSGTFLFGVVGHSKP